MIEYAILVALITVVCVLALQFLGTSAGTGDTRRGGGVGSTQQVPSTTAAG